jgi:hypothetical protein
MARRQKGHSGYTHPRMASPTSVRSTGSLSVSHRTLLATHRHTQSQQKMWPQGVAVGASHVAKHSMHVADESGRPWSSSFTAAPAPAAATASVPAGPGLRERARAAAAACHARTASCAASRIPSGSYPNRSSPLCSARPNSYIRPDPPDKRQITQSWSRDSSSPPTTQRKHALRLACPSPPLSLSVCVRTHT